MLDELVFKFGEECGATALRIRPGAMTVLVGPNNSGKSLTLREIERFVKSRRDHWGAGPDDKFHIVAATRPTLPQPGELRDKLLREIEQNIAPFRDSLVATSELTPRTIVEKFDPGQLWKILEQLNKLGHLNKLAEGGKIDPTLLTCGSFCEKLRNG